MSHYNFRTILFTKSKGKEDSNNGVTYAKMFYLRNTFESELLWSCSVSVIIQKLTLLPFCQTSVSMLIALMLLLCRGLQLCWRYCSCRLSPWCCAWCTWLEAVPRPPTPFPRFGLGCESSSSKMSETESVIAGLFVDSPNEKNWVSLFQPLEALLEAGKQKRPRPFLRKAWLRLLWSWYNIDIFWGIPKERARLKGF